MRLTTLEHRCTCDPWCHPEGGRGCCPIHGGTTAVSTQDADAQQIDHGAPAVSYLARLSPGSRPTQLSSLKIMAERLTSPGTPSDPTSFPWHRIDRARAGALRAWLVETYAPATANRYLAALRGVL